MVKGSLNRSRILKFKNVRTRIKNFGTGAESESENITLGSHTYIFRVCVEVILSIRLEF